MHQRDGCKRGSSYVLLTRPRLLTTLNSTIPNHVGSTVDFFTHLNGRRLGTEPKTDPDAGFTRGVMIPALDPAPESDLWPFWDSDSNSGSRLVKIRIHIGSGSTSGS